MAIIVLCRASVGMGRQCNFPPAKTAETNTPTESVGGNIATLAETEKPSNQPLAVESIAPVATENVATV